MGEGGSYIHKSIDQMESIWRGSYVRARGELGVTAFGLGVLRLPPNFDRAPTHNHSFDGQEEVYMPIAGSGAIVCGGEAQPLDTNTAIRVGPSVSRTFTSGPDGVTMLVAGGTPGKAYEPFAPLELGAPEPNTPELPGIKAEQGHVSSDDYMAKELEQTNPFRSKEGLAFYPLGKALGVSAFGLAVVDIDYLGGATNYPLHSHEEDGQTEVFVVARGGGSASIDGEDVQIREGEMLAIEPAAKRGFTAGDDGLRLIVIGATAGEPFGGNRPTLG